MFGIGLPELGIILVIALVVFGPSRLPEIGKAVGKTIGEFKRGAEDIKKEVMEPLENEKEEKKQDKA